MAGIFCIVLPPENHSKAGQGTNARSGLHHAGPSAAYRLGERPATDRDVVRDFFCGDTPQ